MTHDDRGVYSPPPDEYDRFDVGEEDDSRRGPLLLIVAAAVLIAFIAVIYTAYHQGFRSGGRSDAPIISANPGPLKAAPKNPGGSPPEDTGSAAYDPMDEKTNSEDITIVPPPEEPAARESVKSEPKPKPVVQTLSPAQKPVAEVRPKPAPKSTFNIHTDGKFVVQLGAFRSEAQATDSWKALRNRLPVMMDGTLSDIQRADRGAKGVFYRLRAAAFTDRATARVFCEALKTKGRDCLVVSR